VLFTGFSNVIKIIISTEAVDIIVGNLVVRGHFVDSKDKNR